MPAWFYMLRLQSGGLYAGSTGALEKRFQDHLDGVGCRTTRLDPPTGLAHTEEFATYEEAFQRERQVKKWSRVKKEALICGDKAMLKVLARRHKR